MLSRLANRGLVVDALTVGHIWWSMKLILSHTLGFRMTYGGFGSFHYFIKIEKLTFWPFVMAFLVMLSFILHILLLKFYIFW